MLLQHPASSLPLTVANANQNALKFNTQGHLDAYLQSHHPDLPVAVFHPFALTNTVKHIVNSFSGTVLYAVKCNAEAAYLENIYTNGVSAFDVASIEEVRLLRQTCLDADLYFMNPVKAPEAIKEAYHQHNVKRFVLDHAFELDKIKACLPNATDLELFVRIAVPKGDVATDFSSKFGCTADEGVALLQACRPLVKTLGLSFHVGTQCANPALYDTALGFAAGVIKQAGVTVDVLDVGGGFPAQLDPLAPCPQINAYFQAIDHAIQQNGLQDLALVCEIGRGMVCHAGSLVVRVEGRKNDLLYINDGVYGRLLEAGPYMNLSYPARLITGDARLVDPEMPLQTFRLAGPTCDSVDMMTGGFHLPATIQIGDYIQLSQLGAYGSASQTRFNGFGQYLEVTVF
jgi:ornithine decarboxylase